MKPRYMVSRMLMNSHALFNGASRSWRMGIGASSDRITGPTWAPNFFPPHPGRSESWWLGLRASWSMKLRHPGVIVSLERPRSPSNGFQLRGFGIPTRLNGFGVRLADAYSAWFIVAVRGNYHRVVKDRFDSLDDRFKPGDGADKVAVFLGRQKVVGQFQADYVNKLPLRANISLQK